MEVYVITRAKPLEDERYFGIASSFKNAEKKIRKSYPHVKRLESYTFANGKRMQDNDFELFFIRKETLD